MRTTNYRTSRTLSPYWQKVQDERDAANAKLGAEMKAYCAARKAWEQGGKVGKQPSLVDFQTA